MLGHLTAEEQRYASDILQEEYRPQIETSNPALANILDEIQRAAYRGSMADYFEEFCRHPEGLLREDMLINAYPFGTPTGELYPTFLGICGKGGDCRSVGELFGAAARYCERVENDVYHEECEDSSGHVLYRDFAVCLFTDRWSKSAFQAYEPTFLYYAAKYRISIRIFLIIGIGMVEVPFLPKKLSVLKNVIR